MKVFHLINTLSAGGAELHLLALCRGLRARGVEVAVGCLREHVTDSRSLAPDFEAAGIPVQRFHADRRFDARFLPALVKTTRALGPDIMHSHLPRADFAAAVTRRWGRAPVWISSVHDIYSQSWSGKWALPVFNVIWRRADALLAISGGVRDWLVHSRGLPADRITVIRYGIEPGRFDTPAVDLRQQWDLTGRRVIGTIGRLESRKGHETLIRAMPAVLAAVPDAVLLIAGHDPWGYGGTLRALIASLGLGDRVRVVGFQADVASFINALEVFAFASRSEGFGLVLAEVMDAGKPVVASRIAPITEIVDDERTGVLVERDNPGAFAQAIVRMLTAPDQARAMGASGRRRARELFSASRMTAETLALYQKVAQRAAAGLRGMPLDPRRSS